MKNGLKVKLLPAMFLMANAAVKINAAVPDEILIRGLDADVSAPYTIEAFAASADDLAGTCYKGLCCTSPSCGRWSDSDRNGICDRGV